MENTKPYLIQYIDVIAEWDAKGLTYADATESEKTQLWDLLEKSEKHDDLTDEGRAAIVRLKSKMI